MRRIEISMNLERPQGQVSVKVEAIVRRGRPERISDVDGGSPAEPNEFEVVQAIDEDGNIVELTDEERDEACLFAREI